MRRAGRRELGCSTCSAPSNGVAACDGQAGCGFTCTAGYVVCNGTCCPQVVVTGATLFATQGVEMGGVVATLADAATGEAASALTASIDWGDYNELRKCLRQLWGLHGQHEAHVHDLSSQRESNPEHHGNQRVDECQRGINRHGDSSPSVDGDRQPCSRASSRALSALPQVATEICGSRNTQRSESSRRPERSRNSPCCKGQML